MFATTTTVTNCYDNDFIIEEVVAVNHDEALKKANDPRVKFSTPFWIENYDND